jgi:hypothetical protein
MKESIAKQSLGHETWTSCNLLLRLFHFQEQRPSTPTSVPSKGTTVVTGTHLDTISDIHRCQPSVTRFCSRKKQ